MQHSLLIEGNIIHRQQHHINVTEEKLYATANTLSNSHDIGANKQKQNKKPTDKVLQCSIRYHFMENLATQTEKLNVPEFLTHLNGYTLKSCSQFP